eukprot:9283479-Pyramimonas_sp.AAC.1
MLQSRAVRRPRIVEDDELEMIFTSVHGNAKLPVEVRQLDKLYGPWRLRSNGKLSRESIEHQHTNRYATRNTRRSASMVLVTHGARQRLAVVEAWTIGSRAH